MKSLHLTIPNTITKKDIERIFSTFGKIERIYIALDRVTKESRGFAYLSYFNIEDAERALSSFKDDSIIKIRWAIPKK